MEATYELIEQTGSLEPSLRDILAHAGLSTQGFYRYFQSKDELMLVLLDEGRRRLVEYLTHRMQTERARRREKVRSVDRRGARAGLRARVPQPGRAPSSPTRTALAQLFPSEQQASVDMLVDLLVEATLRPRHRAPSTPSRCAGTPKPSSGSPSPPCRPT